MQLSSHSSSSSSHDHVLEYYLRKNFFKTASLMANSCKSAALLGNYSTELVQASYEYGKHVGMAFQLVDDVLDFEGSAESLGKPALSDLQAGLATAPVLFALNDNTPNASSLLEMMQRKFRQEGDVEQTCEIVKQSNGMERTKELAQVHAELAMDAALQLGDSVHRDALVHLAYKVVDRTR
jgi:hexaprenyl-diphosphate synthase